MVQRVVLEHPLALEAPENLEAGAAPQQRAQWLGKLPRLRGHRLLQGRVKRLQPWNTGNQVLELYPFQGDPGLGGWWGDRRGRRMGRRGFREQGTCRDTEGE